MKKLFLIFFISIFFIFTQYSNVLSVQNSYGLIGDVNPTNPVTNITNIVIINITNNITNFVTNNITNNITNDVYNNITMYVNYTNNITNDIYINQTINMTNNISNNFYSAWLTIINNISTNVTINNNVTVNNIINTSGLEAENYTFIFNIYNITNNIFDQLLNTFNDVMFNSLIINNTMLNTGLRMLGNINDYYEINIQNLNNGNSSSSDLVATANNGDEDNNYIDVGINGENYNNPDYSSGVANDGYILLKGGNLAVISMNPNKTINFFVGGAKAENIRMSINDTYTKVFNKLLSTGYYGELYATTQYNRTLTLQNTLYTLTNFTNGEMSGVTANNGVIQILNSGLYEITFNMNALIVGPGDDVYYIFQLNNISINKSLMKMHYTYPYYNALTYSFYQRFNVNDTLTLNIVDTFRSGAILTETNRNILIQRIGD